MGANPVTKVLKCVDNSNTIRTIKLYDDKSDFVDYDGGKYFAIHDGSAIRYVYCSDKLWTNTKGETTSCLIAKFIDKMNSDGTPHIRYMYTEQPSETESLYKTITSSISNNEILSQENNVYGAYIYTVNTKGKNGNSGSNGSSGYHTSSGSGVYIKYTGHQGSAGSGGSGGSGGTTVSNTLTIGDKSLNITLAGMPGAGGGGGGGGGHTGADFYPSGDSRHSDPSYTYSGGSAGGGGTANNSSKTYKIRISHNVSIKGNITITSNDSRYSGSSGSSGQTGNSYNYGGNGGKSGDGNGGSAGSSGSKNKSGGNGGSGASAGDSRTASVTGTAVNTVARHGQQFNSSSNSFSNTIANNGGVVITKIIASYSV